jgi:hypothetical protein
MTTKNAKRFFNLPLLILAMMMCLSASALYSQTDEHLYDYDDEYYEDDLEMPDNFNRRLGIGPIFGSNTIVDRYSTEPKSFSNEGILSIGGLINYRFMENFIIQGAYTYSKNSTFVNRLPDSIKNSPYPWLEPNYHQAIELTLIAMAKPRNMVNFYASLGATYFMNEISMWDWDAVANKGNRYYVTDDQLGINTGVGGFVNIDLKSIGTLTFYAEWKLSFRLSPTVLAYDPRQSPGSDAYRLGSEYTSMYSIPRGGIIWYVPWIKNGW